MPDDDAPHVRIDKWLWAARFFRTRSIAAAAVEGGRVHLNGERTKPAKILKVGDSLSVRIGPYNWEITVAALSERRGRASEAQKLYQETPDSRRLREERAATLKAEHQSNPFLKGRPTKKARRDLIRLKQGHR